MQVKHFVCVFLVDILYDRRALSTQTYRPTKSQRQRLNGTVTDITMASWELWCKAQVNGFDCGDGGYSGKFYYDIALGDCRAEDVGRLCKHNVNIYDSVSECHDACAEVGEHPIIDSLAPAVYCRLQPDFGGCNGYHPRFYFDLTQRTCRGFSYSGCGGNLNRFISMQVCTAVCLPVVEY